MNVFDLSAKITMDINGYLKNMGTAKAIALSTTSAIGGAVSGFMKDSIEVGKKFDTSMSQVAATMGLNMTEMADQTGKADTAFGQFEGNLREFAQFMGRNTAFTASQAADALNYMALAGYNTQESMNMLPNVLNLAAAGNMDLASASDMVTDTQTAFGIEAKRVTQMVDEMAKASSTGNTSVEQLGSAFLVVGGLAKELNGGLVTLKDGTKVSVDGVQELEIALTAMANAGIKGSEAGTHMRNMLMKLSSPTSDGAKRMEELGVNVFDANGNMRSLHDIMDDLNVSLSKLTQEEKIQAISDLFNARDLSSAEALLSAVGQDWDEIGESILGAEGAAQKMADTQLDNLAGDTKLFESALEGLQIALSDSATPALRKMKQTGTQAITLLTEEFQKLPPEAQTAIGLIADFGGKALSVAPQAVGMAGSIAQISSAMASAGSGVSSFVALLNPVTAALALTTAAIGVAVASYVNYKQRIAEAAAEEKAFAEQVSSSADAYDNTHEQLEILVGGQNEYIDTASRISQLESMRVQVANAQITAQNNLNDAQSQLNDTTARLTAAQQELNEANADGGWNFKMTTEEIESLKLEQEYLTEAVNDANTTYEQTTQDLADINTALDQAQTELEEQKAAVAETESAYSQFGANVTEAMVASASAIVDSVLDVQEAMTGSIQSIGNWFDAVTEKEAQDATQMKQNLRDQIDAVQSWEEDLNYLADKGINQEFLKYLANMGPEASEYVAAMKEDILNGSQDTVDEWNSLYADKLNLELGINDEAQNIYDAIIAMGEGGSDAFDQMTEAFNLGGYNAGEGITLGLVQGLKEKVDDAKEAAKEAGESSIEGLDEGAGVNSPSWKAERSGIFVVSGFVNGLNGQASNVNNAASSLGANAVNGLGTTTLYQGAYSSGQWLDVGLANGIYAHANNAINAAYYVAQSVMNVMSSAMQINSPSKVGDYFGEMWDKGIEGGIRKNADAPIKAMRQMTSDIIDEANVNVGTTDISRGTNALGYDAGYYNGGMNVTMNIYGAQGQDINELAVLIGNELERMLQQRQAVWA